MELAGNRVAEQNALNPADFTDLQLTFTGTACVLAADVQNFRKRLSTEII